MPKKNGRTPFEGFSRPNYTQVPDELFDVLMPELTEAELRVLLYVIRRTFGFKKDSDDISLKQIVEGITTQDGRVLDRGAGVGKTAAVRAVKGLVERGVIAARRNQSQERGNEPTTYAVRFKGEDPLFTKGTRGGSPSEQALVHQGNTQETVRQQTDVDLSNFERSRPSELTEDVPTGRGAPPPTEPNRPADEATEPVGREELVAKTREVPLGEVLELRRRAAATIGQGGRTDAAPPPASTVAADRPARSRTGQLKGTTEERERLRAFLGDFAAELGDEASLASSITRALNLFREAQVPPERWGDYLYQARAITQEHTAQITKQSSNGRAIRRKNKMPYFFEVLEDLLGLRAAPSPPPA